jgi:hypothetical protein
MLVVRSPSASRMLPATDGTAVDEQIGRCERAEHGADQRDP